MYILLIDVRRDTEQLQEWLRNYKQDDADLVVLDRDVVAAQLLRSDAAPCLVVRNGAEGLESSPLLDVPKDSGMQLPPVVVLCEPGTEEAVSALAEPALVPVPDSIDEDTLLGRFDTLLHRVDGEVVMDFGGKSTPELHFGCFIGESAAMHNLYRALEKVARSESTCLVTGESGTGKELAAEVVHQLSARGKEAFVAVNCGAIPENLLESEFFGHKRGAFTGAVSDHKGRFEMAEGGTLFLDEVGEMQLGLQVKLLRALQTGDIQPVGSNRSKTVDVRVVAATNRDLEVEMKEGNFREDLFYRLAIIPLQMPPLRQRAEDIPLLVEHLVEKINRRVDTPIAGMTRGALDGLCRYEWPGNIRELRATLERMSVMAEGSVLSVDDLPSKIRSAVGVEEDSTEEGRPLLPEDGLKLSAAVDDYETALILQALERTGWNKNQAARLLNMNRTTLVEKLKKKNLTGPTRDSSLGAAGAK